MDALAARLEAASTEACPTIVAQTSVFEEKNLKHNGLEYVLETRPNRGNKGHNQGPSATGRGPK